MKKIILSLILSASLPLQAMAADAMVDIDVHASTLGMGAGFAVPLSENIAARLSVSKYTYSYQTTSDNIKYDSSLKLENVAALLDWHVFSGATHLTGGMIYNNNSFDMVGIPGAGSQYNINGSPYTLTSLNANISFNKFVPYLGFGWSGRASKTGFSFKSDIGVMYQGAPQATLTVTGSGASAAAADVAVAQAKLNEDMKSFSIYPVISIGMGYAF
jgi:hypothetical protein